jgi:hypothetical protein
MADERGPGSESPSLHPELGAIVEELRAATDRLAALHGAIPPESWTRRPSTGGWSPAECVAHLNLTHQAFLPGLRSGMEEARARAAARPGAPVLFRRGLLGWLLWRTMGPPVRMRVRTGASFVPTGEDPPELLKARFDQNQAELMALVEGAEGLPLGDVRVPSPFAEKVGYTLFAAFGIMARHQHRHLWQAEQAAEAAGSAGSEPR